MVHLRSRGGRGNREFGTAVALLILGGLILTACTAEPQQVEVTRVVEMESTRLVEVEATRLVEVAVEATRIVEVEATRIVEVEVPAETDAAVEEEPSGPPPFEPPTAVVASGLAQPRQMTYDADGNLYVAEAGVGGDTMLAIDAENAIAAGLSSQISRVDADGDQSVVLPGLPSFATSPGNNGFRGGQGILITDDAYWVAFGEGPVALYGLPFLRSVVKFDRETWRIEEIIDTGTAALDAGQPSPDAVNSDPTDLAIAADGTLFIADAGCNCLWTWTTADGLQPFNFWDEEDNPVPTGVAIGPDGDIYVSFLSGFPFEPESTRIERWSAAGELVNTFGGLTLVTDVHVGDDGTVYAVEFASGLGDRGFNPDSGRVVAISDDGEITTLLDGLRQPYGLAQAPDGSLVVSINASGDLGRNGMVIRVDAP